MSALFPAVLWLLVRGIRDGRAWTWGILAIVVGLAILSPHPQLVQYMLLASGVFALYVSFADHPRRGKLPRPIAIRRLAFALGAVVLGGLISAIQYWPVIGASSIAGLLAWQLYEHDRAERSLLFATVAILFFVPTVFAIVRHRNLQNA